MCEHTEIENIYLSEVRGTTIRFIHGDCVQCKEHFSSPLTEEQYIGVLELLQEDEYDDQP